MMDAKKLLGLLAVGALLAASLGAVETLAQRRRQLEEMSAEQREELFRNEQQFRDLLTPQEQQRIRDLHNQIESAPDREKLLRHDEPLLQLVQDAARSVARQAD